MPTTLSGQVCLNHFLPVARTTAQKSECAVIVSSMTLAEVGAALRKDVVQLQRHVAERFADAEERQRKQGLKGVVVESGEFTSPDRIQWHYVVTISSRKTTLYPMGWYFTQEGIHLVQVDQEGPATYIGPHVLERYRQRYYKDAEVLTAAGHFHLRNYDKACQPREYRNLPDTIASAIEDGYLLGQLLKEENVVRFHTFYDVDMGTKEACLKDMRRLLEWRRYYSAVTPNSKGDQKTDYVSWGRGFELRLQRLRRAA